MRSTIRLAFLAAVFGAALGNSTMARAQSADEKIDPTLRRLQTAREVDYLIVLREAGDLSAAPQIADRDARGRFVYERLRDVASRSQGGLLAFLQRERAAGRAQGAKPFFSMNAIGVRSTPSTLRAVAAFPEVARIVPAAVATIPPPLPAVEQAVVQGEEWNLIQIGAPRLWLGGVRGQGITVANIDTGVQFDHPALVRQYRGNLGGGAFDHNFNWWDASGLFGGPGEPVPNDTDGHGTHTMGTMVGDDGGVNRIGVAPDARWMACKACSGPSCSLFGLLECGDFVLAPWDLAGNNPDPARRPHVVNNSWAFSLGGISIYQAVVQNWRAAGIFPAFAAGNAGPACNTAASPGDYPEAFATGASDAGDAIAGFSSRGPSAFGVVKPDATAPGVSVRSSVPTNGYATFSGTSMASPHSAGLVALLWSSHPELARDVPATEQKLRPAARILNTAEACGGDGPRDHPNNVFGWGRQDAIAAFNPLNIFTDRSVYAPGEAMAIRMSLVNPFSVPLEVDLYFGLQVPNGGTLFHPFAIPVTLPPLTKNLDVLHGTHTWTSEAAGAYSWFAVATTPRGSSPVDPATRLGIDNAPFAKE